MRTNKRGPFMIIKLLFNSNFLTVDFDDMDDHVWPQGKYPASCVNIFIRSVSRMEGPSGGYMEDVKGSWQETWWHSHPQHHGWSCLIPSKISQSFVLITSLEVFKEWQGVLHWSTWRILRVPDRILGWHSHPWSHGLLFLTPWKIPKKFWVDIFITSLSILGGIHGGYLDQRLKGRNPEFHVISLV